MKAKIIEVETERMTLDLSACDRSEIMSIINVAHIDEDEPLWLELVSKQKSEMTIEFGKRCIEQGGGYVECEVHSTDFIKPYLERLKSLTGYEFPEDKKIEIHLLRGVFHTHTMVRTYIHAGILYGHGIGQAYGHGGGEKMNETERDNYAEKRLLECMNQAIAKTIIHPDVPEYIQDRNGWGMVRNPKWRANKIEYAPGTESEKLWQELFGLFVEMGATPEQKEILKRKAYYRNEKEKFPTLHDYQGIHLDGYKTNCSWEDFKAGKVPPLPKPEEQKV